MKKSKGKIFMTTLMLVTVGIVMLPNQAKAALQSNGGEPARKGVNDWITQIRKMQAPGGGLGITDTIDETNLTSQNKNFDIHMQKNTEYGAIAILSASSYGNPNKIEDGGTTTGNNTGIVMHLNKEWVAAGPSNTSAGSMRNASGRYKNIYTTSYVEKIGDAIQTVGAWHGASDNTWISSYQSYAGSLARACIVRSRAGSIFSYYGYSYNGWNGYDKDSEAGRMDGDYRKNWSSRAIVVVGSGV